MGAVDPRAIAIIPIVMDELNFLENLKHHYRSLAGWTFAFKDYYAVGLPLYLQDPKLQVTTPGSVLSINFLLRPCLTSSIHSLTRKS